MADQPTCKAPGCDNPADVEVILYDVYRDGGVFFKQDYTCPFLCSAHVAENEREAWSHVENDENGADKSPVSMAEFFSRPKPKRGPAIRQPRGIVYYPYTNKKGAQGFTIYRPL